MRTFWAEGTACAETGSTRRAGAIKDVQGQGPRQRALEGEETTWAAMAASGRETGHVPFGRRGPPDYTRITVKLRFPLEEPRHALSYK